MSEIYIGQVPNTIREYSERKYEKLIPLCFTANTSESTVRMIGIENNKQVSIWCHLKYSTDNRKTWNSWDGSAISLDDCEDNRVFLMADPENPNTDGFSKNNGKSYQRFAMNGSIAASGNIQFLLESTGTRTDVPAYCYKLMFNWCQACLTRAPLLPATTLANNCYDNMFYNCTSLIKSPELPATTLANNCYAQMFWNCNSLTESPNLPATTLAVSCYAHMFEDCDSLTQAPKLTATSLAESCYESMFSSCHSLTTASELPATTLADFCYSDMFDGCTSLAKAPDLPASTLANDCYSYMFGYCTSITKAPILSATTLKNNCYEYMFADCASLSEAPELPATTLANNCYDGIFDSCDLFTECHMKANMSSVYDSDIHGDTTKDVIFDL